MAAVTVSAANAQFQVSSTSGDLLDSMGGVAYSNGDYFGGAYFDGLSGTGNASFAGATNEATWIGKPYGSRGMVRFTSLGGNFMPTDSSGNSSASTDGETRSFTTWNNAFLFGSNSTLQYNFAVEADATGAFDINGDRGVQIDYFDMSSPNLFGSVNGLTTTSLDNGAADMDSRLGFILIDKTLTPDVLGTLAGHADGSVTRGKYFGPDGDIDSPFWDGAFSAVNLNLFQGATYVAGWGSQFSGELGSWAPGEAGTNAKSFAAQNLNMDFHFAGIADGTYDAVVDTALWQNLGGTDMLNLFGTNTYPGTSWSVFSGGTNHYTLTIVPEPGTMALAGIALAGLVARRRKKTQ